MQDRIRDLQNKIAQNKARKKLAKEEIKNLKKQLKEMGIKDVDKAIKSLENEISGVNLKLDQEVKNAEEFIAKN